MPFRNRKKFIDVSDPSGISPIDFYFCLFPIEKLLVIHEHLLQLKNLRKYYNLVKIDRLKMCPGFQ